MVRRPRVLDRLQRLVQHRNVVVVAPAGFGKTSLLIDFATESSLPVSWLTLDEGDRDPWLFLEGLALAVAPAMPDVASDVLDVLARPGVRDWGHCRDLLIDGLSSVGGERVVFLDDWHLVEATAALSALVERIIARCPQVHLILATRYDPALPNLLLLRARRHLQVLDAVDLAFDAAEAAAVITAEGDRVVTPDEVAALTEQTGGWIAAILLSVQANQRAALQIHSPSVFGFLAEQVFSQQPPELQHYLFESSLFETVTVALGREALGRDDVEQMIETAVARRLFLQEFGDGVWRYHPLFRDFLRERWRRQEPAAHAARCVAIARRCLERQRLDEAFAAACAASDMALAQDILTLQSDGLYAAGRWETLHRLIAMVPLGELRPVLGCVGIHALLNLGLNDQVGALLEQIERNVAVDEERAALALVRSRLARIAGNYEESERQARAAMAAAVDEALTARARRSLGIALHRLGRTADALAAFDQALIQERSLAHGYEVAQLQHDRSICLRTLGRYSEAEAALTDADLGWAQLGNQGLRVVSLTSLAIVRGRQGRVAEAHDALRTARDLMASGGAYRAAVHSTLGDLFSDVGLWDDAQRHYDDAAQAGGSAHLQADVVRSSFRLLVRRGHVEAAMELQGRIPETTDQDARCDRWWSDTVLAIAQGSLPAARGVLDAAVVETGGLLRRQWEGRAHLLAAAIDLVEGPGLNASARIERAWATADDIGGDWPLVVDLIGMPALLNWMAGALPERFHEVQARRRAAQEALGATVAGRPAMLVRTLGHELVLIDGVAADIGWRKAREILFYLLAHPRGVSGERLCDLFWPDLTPERARKTLRNAIYELRKAMPKDVIVHHDGRYRLDADVIRLDYDVQRLQEHERAVEGGAPVDLAVVQLYEGSYLAGWDSEWCEGLRAHVEQQALVLMLAAARSAEQQRQWGNALEWYRKALAIDPLDETVHADIMRVLWRVGRRAAALEQFGALQELIRDAFQVDIEAESPASRLYEQIRASNAEATP